MASRGESPDIVGLLSIAEKKVKPLRLRGKLGLARILKRYEDNPQTMPLKIRELYSEEFRETVLYTKHIMNQLSLGCNDVHRAYKCLRIAAVYDYLTSI